MRSVFPQSINSEKLQNEKYNSWGNRVVVVYISFQGKYSGKEPLNVLTLQHWACDLFTKAFIPMIKAFFLRLFDLEVKIPSLLKRKDPFRETVVLYIS